MTYVNYAGQYHWVRPGKYQGPFKNGFAPATFNLIKKLVFHECSVPFQVYVETFIPCFVKMVLTIIVPQSDDIFRAQAEGMVADRFGRSGRRRSHMSLVPLATVEGPAATKAAQGLKAILALSAPLETIGYGMLLYGATEQFAHDWTSLLYNFQHCARPPSTGPLQRHATQYSSVAPGVPFPIFLNVLDQDRAGWGSSNQICPVPFGHYSVTLEATFTSQAITDSEVEVLIEAPLAFTTQPRKSGRITLSPGGTGSCCVQADLFFPAVSGGSIQWLFDGDAVPVGIIIQSASVSIYQFQPGR